jgi:hypothetical protein
MVWICFNIAQAVSGYLLMPDPNDGCNYFLPLIFLPIHHKE